MVERGYIWAGTSPPPAAEPTLQANYSEALDSRPPSPSASELSHGSSNRDVSPDSYSSAGETASDSGSSPGMPDLQPRGDNSNSEMMDLCSPAFSDPPALTTSSQVVRLWKECHRAEQILAGATEDDGAGIHDDPLTRYLACHTRLRQLLPPTATSPATSDSLIHPPFRMVTNGECHLQHNAYQSELTLLRPKPLRETQPPYLLIRSHHSPLRVHYRSPHNAARSSYARDLLERHPPRRTSQPQATGGSTASRMMAQKHWPSTRTPTRTSQSPGCSALALLMTCQRCRG